MARVPDSVAVFGPNDMYITKSIKSLEEKQERMLADGASDPLGSIDDALRGQRQSLDDQRAQHSHAEVEKARNDSEDR